MKNPTTRERTRIDVEQFARMGEAGVFPPDARIELLDGELLNMPRIGTPHAWAVSELARQFTLAAQHVDHYVSVQNPLILSRFSEPLPDVMLVRGPALTYARRKPEPLDVLVLIEVADSTVGFDRQRKVPLYARGFVAEVWLLDLDARRLEVHTRPGRDGYALRRTPAAGELIAPEGAPDVAVDWVRALGPGD